MDEQSAVQDESPIWYSAEGGSVQVFIRRLSANGYRQK
jgi:hypothetical protein